VARRLGTIWRSISFHVTAVRERRCTSPNYLLQWHGDGQLPFASLVRRQPHADSVVRQAEDWLRKHYRESNAVTGVVEQCGIPERSLKRRFSAATGSTVIGYVQNLRIEEAKRLLESGDTSSDNIAAAVGYENPAFFRKLFKRCTDSLRDIIAACFVPSPMQVALMATMPWDKIEESQTEPLLGRKLLAGYPGPWLWTPSHLQQCPAAVVMVDDFRFRATQPTDMMITDRAKD
jgi:AraC-like DNA-binding protein